MQAEEVPMRPMTRNESEVPATTIAWRVAEIVLLIVLALLTTPRAGDRRGTSYGRRR